MSKIGRAVDFVWEDTRIGRKMKTDTLRGKDHALAQKLDEALSNASQGQRIATIYAIGDIVRLLDG